MITFPNAKINLGLNITEKRADGYHNLETIFYPIHLQDALEVTRREKDDTPYTLHVKGTALEGAPEDNLVVKAYELLKKDHEMPPIDIHLFKHIPTGAGLGGGSSDCAFMIKLLNEKFRLNLSLEEMEAYAAVRVPTVPSSSVTNRSLPPASATFLSPSACRFQAATSCW